VHVATVGTRHGATPCAGCRHARHLHTDNGTGRCSGTRYVTVSSPHKGAAGYTPVPCPCPSMTEQKD
jgi:hypothetical protein